MILVKVLKQLNQRAINKNDTSEVLKQLNQWVIDKDDTSESFETA